MLFFGEEVEGAISEILVDWCDLGSIFHQLVFQSCYGAL